MITHTCKTKDLIYLIDKAFAAQNDPHFVAQNEPSTWLFRGVSAWIQVLKWLQGEKIEVRNLWRTQHVDLKCLKTSQNLVDYTLKPCHHPRESR